MQVILVSLLFAGLAFAKPEEKGSYTTKYDNVNLEEIFSNDRLYEKYYKCLIDEGPCTPDAKELKEIIPDALKDACAKCNEKQMDGLEKTFVFLTDKKKEDLKKLRSVYDPTGEYWKKYKVEAAKRGIKLED